MTGQLVRIDEFTKQYTPTPSAGGGSGPTGSAIAGPSPVWFKPGGEHTGTLDALRFYEDRIPGDLASRGLELILQTCSHLKAARSEDARDNFIAFDTNLMSAGTSLRKAFRYRSIGTGFAAVVNAALLAVTNRTPEPMAPRQITVLLQALEQLAKTPYLHYDTAMRLMDEMEAADLNIDSPALDAFAPDYGERD